MPQASNAEADVFDESMELAMMQMGGPPDGLMVHFARPAKDGFLLCNVWRNEADMRSFYDDVVVPKLADVGLAAEEPAISPIWTFARPWPSSTHGCPALSRISRTC